MEQQRTERDPEAQELDAMARRFLRWDRSLTLAMILAGIAAVLRVVGRVGHTHVWLPLVVLFSVAALVLIARRVGRTQRARSAFAGPEARMSDGASGQPTRVNVRRVESPSGPLWLLTDPEAREVIGFVDDPDVEVWAGRRGRPATLLSFDELWSEEGALIVGTPVPIPFEAIPPALHAALHTDYREPPAALRWSATADMPLRLAIERAR